MTVAEQTNCTINKTLILTYTIEADKISRSEKKKVYKTHIFFKVPFEGSLQIMCCAFCASMAKLFSKMATSIENHFQMLGLYSLESQTMIVYFWMVELKIIWFLEYSSPNIRRKDWYKIISRKLKNCNEKFLHTYFWSVQVESLQRINSYKYVTNVRVYLII